MKSEAHLDLITMQALDQPLIFPVLEDGRIFMYLNNGLNKGEDGKAAHHTHILLPFPCNLVRFMIDLIACVLQWPDHQECLADIFVCAPAVPVNGGMDQLTDFVYE